jgi:hypothetical protein
MINSFASLLKLPNEFFIFEEEKVQLQPFVGDVSLKTELESLDITNAPYLFYDEHGANLPANTRGYIRAETALRYSTIAPHVLLVVRFEDEEHARPAIWSELINPAIPTFRYLNSCIVNTDRYLKPLLEYAIGGGCKITTVCGGGGGPEFRVTGLQDEVQRKAFVMDVAGAQPLMILRAIGLADDAVATTLGYRYSYSFDQTRLPLNLTLPGVFADGKLVGSGKYHPIKYHERTIEILSGLLALGLVRRCPDSYAIILTAAGARLLDVLTPRMFDPDDRLRWFDTATDLIKPEHAEASERWVRAFYGEMRRIALRVRGPEREETTSYLQDLYDMLLVD